jgi:hypothetical protein
MLVTGTPFFHTRAGQIVALAVRHRIPANLYAARVCRSRGPHELWV